jgi:hypothetical protein
MIQNNFANQAARQVNQNVHTLKDKTELVYLNKK